MLYHRDPVGVWPLWRGLQEASSTPFSDDYLPAYRPITDTTAVEAMQRVDGSTLRGWGP